MKKGILLLLFVLSGMYLNDCCNSLLNGKVDISSYSSASSDVANENNSLACHCDVSCFRDFCFHSYPKLIVIYLGLIIGLYKL